jgi:very-short-patch-repair endonuclease
MRDPELLARAKQMRREPTGPELRLWLELRAKRFHGAKFRRQVVIGGYIADFACRAPMLVIEVDGDTHALCERYDAVRTVYLEARGYRVLRFTNDEVMGNLDGVLTVIAGAVGDSPSPNPLP